MRHLPKVIVKLLDTDLRNEDNLKNKDNLKNEDDPKHGDDPNDKDRHKSPDGVRRRQSQKRKGPFEHKYLSQ